MNKKKTIILLLLAITLSLAITVLTTDLGARERGWSVGQQQIEFEGIIPQDIVEILDTPHLVNKIFYGYNYVGVITDISRIDYLLRSAFLEKYQAYFPDSELSLGEDVFIVQEKSYFVFENVDDSIIAFIEDNDLFSVEVDKVIFSNGEVIFVRDINDFEEAQEMFLQNFINVQELSYLRRNMLPPEIVGLGQRTMSISIAETTAYTRGHASINDIYMNREEILEFLSFGHDMPIRFIYYTRPYDTIAGVGRRVGLTDQQILTINSDILTSVDQILAVGTRLNVTYFSPPINIIVEREHIFLQSVYPIEPEFIYDAAVREGLREVIYPERIGSERVTFLETYINGVLQDGALELSRELISHPQRARIRVGTMVIPNVGSGNFRFPVNNVRITCGWYCYAGHRAIDVVDTQNRHGNVYAADRGTVIRNSFHPINGWYMIIDHNNGFTTYYGHLHVPGFFPVGTVVARGEVIGQIGATGQATGPHVHFFITYQGVRFNPCLVLGPPC